MSSKHVGIEDARKALGPLVEEAQDGTEIVLTRHGRPVARIVSIEERPMPTFTEWISTIRSMATPPTVHDTLGLDQRDPAGWALSSAEVAYEIKPFADLIAAIDAFFGDDLTEALSGPEAAEAESEVRRIIAEQLATVTMRLALTAAALSTVNLVTETKETLRTLAGTLLQRAADQRFIEIVSPLATRAAAA